MLIHVGALIAGIGSRRMIDSLQVKTGIVPAKLQCGQAFSGLIAHSALIARDSLIQRLLSGRGSGGGGGGGGSGGGVGGVVVGLATAAAAAAAAAAASLPS